MVLTIISAECRAGARSGFQFLTPAFFLLIAAVLIPMTGPAGSPLAAGLAHGAIWLAVIFAALIGLHDLFSRDAEDGTLTLYAQSECPLMLFALGKLIAHFITHMLPLLCMLPVAFVMLGMPPSEWQNYFVILFMASIWLIWLGAVIAAILTAQPQSALLLPFIALPMAIPAVIFGAGGKFYFLAALCAAAFPLAPLAIAAILRGAEENH